MDHDEFANVTWQNSATARDPASTVGSPGADIEGQENPGTRRHPDGPLGTHADALDLAGVGDGVLECTVTSPIKENDGTKDAYVSYLVTTNVGSTYARNTDLLLTTPDNLPIFPETHDISPQTLHRLRILIQDTIERIPRMCRTAVAG